MALSFAFDTSKGETPEMLARKRALADAILGRSRAPQNIGEGLVAIGDGIVANVMNRRAEKGEQAGLAKAGSLFDSIASAIRGDGFPEAPVIGADAVPGLMDSGTDMATQRVASAFGDAPAGVPDAPTIRAGMIERGLPPHVADAFLMNFKDESGLNPGINERNPIVPGSRGGFGLAQWTGPRRRALEAFAAERGVPVSDMGAQLDFLMSELQGSEAKAYQAIRNAPDTGSAAAAIVNKFLRPAEQHRAAREARYLRAGSTPAVNALNTFAGQPTQVASLDPTIGAAQPGPDMGGLTQDNVNAYAARLAAQMEQEAAPPQTGLPVGTPMATSEKGARVVRTLLDPQPMGGAPMPMQGMPAPAAPQAAQAQPDMTRVSPMAGGSAGVMQPGQPSPVPMDLLLRAAGNPWLMANPGMANVVNTLLKQQMEAQDPMRAIDMDYRRAQIEKLNREAAGGNRRYGLNPIYGQDDQGNTVLGVLGDDGSFKPVDTGGVNISTGVDRVDLGTQWGLLDKRSGQMVGTLPKENYQEAFDTASGTNDAKSAAEARSNLPKVEDNAYSILGMIDSLDKDPYLDSMLGPVNSRLPNVSADSERVQSKMNQIGGQAFLQAFETLKGGGTITEIEGQKATEAIARLNTAQSPQDYREALNELRAIVERGVDRARRSAGMGGGTQAPPGAEGWQDMGGVRIRRKQ